MFAFIPLFVDFVCYLGSWPVYDDLTDVIVLQMKRVIVAQRNRKTVEHRRTEEE